MYASFIYLQHFNDLADIKEKIKSAGEYEALATRYTSVDVKQRCLIISPTQMKPTEDYNNKQDFHPLYIF